MAAAASKDDDTSRLEDGKVSRTNMNFSLWHLLDDLCYSYNISLY